MVNGNLFGTDMSYYIIWKYEVPAENAAEFEMEYGNGGAWHKFFSQSEYYQGTTLLKPTKETEHYVLVDKWVDQPAYESFINENKDGYNGLSNIYRRLFIKEIRVGHYTD